MECAQVRKLLDGYVDGELDVLMTLDIENHLAGCQSCSQRSGNYQTLHTLLGDKAVYSPASDRFRDRVRQTILHEDRPSIPLFARVGTWQAIAALLLIALVGTWGLVRQSSTTRDVLTSEILSNHIRSLMANHLTDVESTDQHTVKPWFDGRLEFSPPVVDLSANGFVLVGGREEYIGGKQVAALVYRRRNHTINLYTWYTTEVDEPYSEQSDQGYNMISWTGKGVRWWAVSDLNTDELGTFCRLIEGRK